MGEQVNLTAPRFIEGPATIEVIDGSFSCEQGDYAKGDTVEVSKKGIQFNGDAVIEIEAADADS